MSYAMQKMAQQYQNHALETSIPQATPFQLVKILYESGIKHMKVMRFFIERKQISEKTQEANRVIGIVYGLKGGLDLEAGGEVAQNLNSLYDYIARRVTEASFHNDVAILNEAVELMESLQEAWLLMPDNYQQLTQQELNDMRSQRLAS
ncbi:flagellar export chaperone FliS [Thiomicrospira sp. ALE5]|uniref:flagellar export chaperone FliS n=1 Tax=Thiomicrospira sp. ALE5 TaxID=748650 RepID=UPI0008F26487|nr:flagellar export chaperone FliS [Thiomicrospira sp. ALE5]SFR59326.1 flagellar protein FliS [Thiomicrospira sp. ALE5]